MKYRIRKGTLLWWSGITAGFAVIVAGAYSWILLLGMVA